jgi:hypothetical protein
LVDSVGQLISTSVQWPTPPVSRANRRYFMALKSNPELKGVHSEPLVSGVTGAWTITRSRRFNGSNDEFLGVVSRAGSSQLILRITLIHWSLAATRRFPHRIANSSDIKGNRSTQERH